MFSHKFRPTYRIFLFQNHTRLGSDLLVNIPPTEYQFRLLFHAIRRATPQLCIHDACLPLVCHIQVWRQRKYIKGVRKKLQLSSSLLDSYPLPFSPYSGFTHNMLKTSTFLTLLTFALPHAAFADVVPLTFDVANAQVAPDGVSRSYV